MANPGLWRMADVWHGYLAEMVLTDEGVEDVHLVPIVIADAHGRAGGPIGRRSHPVFADSERAGSVLTGVIDDSAQLGTRFVLEAGEAISWPGS